MTDQLPLDSPSGIRRTTFEQGFAESERSAAAVIRAGTQITAAARQMQKAAQEGDISKLSKSIERLVSVSEAARQDIANARTAWPFSDATQLEYWSEKYTEELISEGEQAGLTIFERDSRLLTYPSIVQVIPSELAVRIDRKRVTTIRPSYVAKILMANQAKKPLHPAGRFLESLFNAYSLIVPRSEFGNVVRLVQIYQALTLQPGATADYGRGEFARDIFMLDQSGVTETKSGATMSLPASSATRGSKSDLFSFVSPTGEVATYYGVRFTPKES